MLKRFGTLFFLPATLLALQPNHFRTNIAFTGEPLVNLKALQSGFAAVGYKLDIDRMTVANNSGLIEAEAIGLKPFNFEAFSEVLKEEGAHTAIVSTGAEKIDLSLDATKWEWNTAELHSDEGTQLERTQGAQWLRIDEGQIVRIEAPYGGNWYPDVAVLDASMNVLYSVRSSNAKGALEVELPKNAKYLKISNAWGMKSLREGMWIESKSPGR